MADKEEPTMIQKVFDIQQRIIAPKDQKAKNYKYRSAEDVIATLKPFLKEHNLLLIIKDDLVMIGERYYIKATVTLKDIDSEEEFSACAFAREQENLSIMSQGQLSGATSSFARKYALGALLAFDDTEDLDKQIDRDKRKNEPKTDRVLSDAQIKRFYAIAHSVGISEKVAMDTVKAKYGVLPIHMSRKQYDEVCNSLEAKKGK